MWWGVGVLALVGVALLGMLVVRVVVWRRGRDQ